MKVLPLCAFVLLASAIAITGTFAQVTVPGQSTTPDIGSFGPNTSGASYGPGAYSPGAYGPGGYGGGAYGPGAYGPGAYRGTSPAAPGIGGLTGVPAGGTPAPALPRL